MQQFLVAKGMMDDGDGKRPASTPAYRKGPVRIELGIQPGCECKILVLLRQYPLIVHGDGPLHDGLTGYSRHALPEYASLQTGTKKVVPMARSVPCEGFDERIDGYLTAYDEASGRFGQLMKQADAA